jgi:hypothetical protein
MIELDKLLNLKTGTYVETTPRSRNQNYPIRAKNLVGVRLTQERYDQFEELHQTRVIKGLHAVKADILGDAIALLYEKEVASYKRKIK